MKKKSLVIALSLMLVLISALTIGTLRNSYTATAAETKKSTSTTKAKATPTPTPKPKAKAKATPTPKPKKELMVDGVKVNDLLTGKYNNISSVTSSNEIETIAFSSNKVVIREYWLKSESIEQYDEKSYHTALKLQQGKIDETPRSDLKYVYGPAYEYNKSYWFKDVNGYSLSTLDTRKEELAKWKLEPSRFETKETKLTDTEIIIKGTYTLTPPYYAYETEKETKLLGINIIDDGFWCYMILCADEVLHKYFKDVKCDTTLVFNRDAKQITSLELKPKLPKDGYPMHYTANEFLKSSNLKYTFEHNLTEEQLAKLTEAEMVSGIANKFDSIEVKYKTNYNQDFLSRGNYDFSPTFTKDEVETSGFDLSRFEITSSKTDKNTTTINGIYKLSTDSNTLYDTHARESIYWNGALGNYNDVTADVTIVFNAKTKSMMEITLQYNFDARSFIIEESDEYDAPERAVCSHTYTFEVTPEPTKAPTPTPEPTKKPEPTPATIIEATEEEMITGKYNTSTTIQSNYTWIAYYAGEGLEFVANDASTITITKDGLKSSGSYKSNLKATGWELNYKHNSTFKYGETKWKYTDSTGDSWEDKYVKLTKDITKFGFDFSRFKVNKSETSKDTITITGTYTLSTTANTIYDMYAVDLLTTKDVVGNINKVTANVTITLDANTKAMKKAVLEYYMNGEIFGPEYNGRLAAFIDSYTHTFTFK